MVRESPRNRKKKRGLISYPQAPTHLHPHALMSSVFLLTYRSFLGIKTHFAQSAIDFSRRFTTDSLEILNVELLSKRESVFVCKKPLQ